MIQRITSKIDQRLNLPGLTILLLTLPSGPNIAGQRSGSGTPATVRPG